MSSKFRFHFLGMPHTWTSPVHSHCAYTSKVVKALKMFSRRGHTCIDYSNEGADVDCAERVQILSEAERASFFGPFDRHKLYDLKWDPTEPYWRRFNERCIEELRPRVRKGDFIMTLSGGCQVAPVGDAFPGSWNGTPQSVMMVEWGIGYYGTQSAYRVFESETHREWLMGRADQKSEDNSSAVVPNFFDLDDFKVPADPGPKWAELQAWLKGRPYYLFIGRVIDSKGILVAAEVAETLGAVLVVAGQGNWRTESPEDTFQFGAANVGERVALMTNAVAQLNPTHFREPFGGTAVEGQLCGCPVITTDHGAFTQTVDPQWRCASHREFVEAARGARKLPRKERLAIKRRAEARFSLDAVAPLYERYFQRLMDRWGDGWYQMTPIDPASLG
jgi:glycosyltransferase involved in cell wall biosynthesis